MYHCGPVQEYARVKHGWELRRKLMNGAPGVLQLFRCELVFAMREFCDMVKELQEDAELQ